MCGIYYIPEKTCIVYTVSVIKTTNPFALYQIKENPIKWDSFETIRPTTKIKVIILSILCLLNTKLKCAICGLHFKCVCLSRPPCDQQYKTPEPK